LKKEPKTFARLARSIRKDRSRNNQKVFWFFFSKKNRFLIYSGAMTRCSRDKLSTRLIASMTIPGSSDCTM
jgi:hypothetical protein